MSRIATARKLADKLDALAAQLTGEQYTKYGEECPMALNLSWMIGQRYVLQVSEDALYVLENAIRTVEQIAAKATGPLDLEAEGPIFPVGTEVVVNCVNWADQRPQRATVVKAEWDGDCWEYKFAMAEGYTIFVFEGDTSYNVEHYCADEPVGDPRDAGKELVSAGTDIDSDDPAAWPAYRVQL